MALDQAGQRLLDARFYFEGVASQMFGGSYYNTLKTWFAAEIGIAIAQGVQLHLSAAFGSITLGTRDGNCPPERFRPSIALADMQSEHPIIP
jgi:hypothetical protein